MTSKFKGLFIVLVALTLAFGGTADLSAYSIPSDRDVGFYGNKIDLDADSDTSIQASTDDVIDFEIAGIASAIQFNAASIVFEGATADAFETTLAITDPSADRVITIPNTSETIGVASSITDDLIVKADFADEDWGDVSVSTNSVTLDVGVVDATALASGACVYGTEIPTFVVAASANQACDTTCGIATAVVAYDAGTNALVATNSATGDSCVCDGATS